MPISPKLNFLQHTGIPVTHMAVSEAFYQRLGFRRVMKAPFPFDGREGTCVMMQLGTILIELYQLPEHKLGEIRSRHDGHVDHVAFDVDDIDASFHWLRESGFQVLEPEPVFLNFWEKGCRFVNIVGPDGERLEFNQILT